MASASNVFPSPTESASMQPLYFSNLSIAPNTPSFWKLYNLFHTTLSLKPVLLLTISSSVNSFK